MFQTPMIEAKKGKAEIKEFTYNCVLTIIKFCYNFELPKDFSETPLIEMLQFSEMYQMEKFKVIHNFLQYKTFFLEFG